MALEVSDKVKPFHPPSLNKTKVNAFETLLESYILFYMN
jgi:hypothetical protein